MAKKKEIIEKGEKRNKATYQNTMIWKTLKISVQ